MIIREVLPAPVPVDIRVELQLFYAYAAKHSHNRDAKHDLLSAIPKVCCTASFNGWDNRGITGIVANAISTPRGNCVRNEAGNFLFSSFGMMAPPAVTPQI